MGHRATYAIRERGAVRVFYSHWGALSVPVDVFWGPGHAERFILSLDETGEWQQDIWAEGGVALDKDEKVIALYGGDDLRRPEVPPVFVALMGTLWAEAGWTAPSTCRWSRCS